MENGTGVAAHPRIFLMNPATKIATATYGTAIPNTHAIPAPAPRAAAAASATTANNAVTSPAMYPPPRVEPFQLASLPGRSALAYAHDKLGAFQELRILPTQVA